MGTDKHILPKHTDVKASAFFEWSGDAADEGWSDGGMEEISRQLIQLVRWRSRAGGEGEGV
eukprot:9469873-Pyramimonas_sp.AAC.2